MYRRTVVFFILLYTTSIDASNKTKSNEQDFLRHILRNEPFKWPLMLAKTLMIRAPLDNTTVIYYLYNRVFPRNSIIINDDIHLINSHVPVKIIVHGWNQHYYADWCKKMKDVYLKRGFYNVIILDWSKKSELDYLFASLSLRDVGNLIAEFIVRKLVRTKNVPLERIHLISHSLGCHLAGMIGQHVFEMTKRKLQRITALDAAAPIFEAGIIDKNDRLSEDDAEFVDIVHTDGGLLGIKKSIGTVDYFVNGGSGLQPGCAMTTPDALYDDLVCSHKRSLDVFIRSILFTNMLAVPCASWDEYVENKCAQHQSVTFGEWSPHNIKGNYFINVTEKVFSQKVL